MIRLARKLVGRGRAPEARADGVGEPRAPHAEAAALALVLALPRASASLAFRAYRERVERDRPFVCWWCARMQARMPAARLFVLCYTAREAEELRVLIGAEATILQAHRASRLQAFAEAAAAIDCASVAFAAEGLAFAPPDLMRRVHAHHLARGNRFTPVSGLPPGGSPELFDRRFLADLPKATPPAAEEDPARLALWLAASEANAAAAGVARPVRVQPFDAEAAYAPQPGDLPEQLFLPSPRELQFARELIDATIGIGCGGASTAAFASISTAAAAAAAATADALSDAAAIVPEPLDDLRRWRSLVIAARMRARQALSARADASRVQTTSDTAFDAASGSTTIAASAPSAFASTFASEPAPASEPVSDLVSLSALAPASAASPRSGASIEPPAAGRIRRILFVSNASAFSGGENSLCQLAATLDLARFAPHALVGGDGLFAERLRAAGVDVRTPGGGFGGEHGAEDLACVAAAFDAVRPDIVHVNSWPGWPLLHLAQLARVPIVAHCRNANVQPQRDLLLASDRIIAVSDFVRRQILRLDLPAARVRVVYNSVNTDLFDPARIDRAAARARLGLPTDARLVLTIARYAANKRHDLLIDAIDRARRACPRLHLILCGEILGGSAAIHDRVRAEIETRRMTDAVTFMPFTDDVRLLHAAADALVLCSDREPLGRCVLEAMAMARPPIVTDSSGNHEVITHGVTGFVVPANEPAALARQIAAVAEDDALAARVGAAARAHVRGALDGRASASAVMAIYDELIDRDADDVHAEDDGTRADPVSGRQGAGRDRW